MEVSPCSNNSTAFSSRTLINILDAGHVHMLFEKTHKMVFTEIAKLCKFGNCERLSIVEIDIIGVLFSAYLKKQEIVADSVVLY